MHIFNRKILGAGIIKALAMSGLLLLSLGGNAAEVAMDPGDYLPLPAGAYLAAIGYQHAESNAYYSQGNKVPAPFKLTTDIGLARFVKYQKVGDYITDPTIVIPFGQVKLSTPFGGLAPSASSGVGDPLLTDSIWLVNQPEQQRYFAITGMVSVPLGNYEAARGPVNLGENRWKGIFQAAYVTGLGKHFMLDLIGEYSVYGANGNYLGMSKKQDNSYGLQTHLRYMFNPGTFLGFSHYADIGGETKLNGVAQNDRARKSRLLIDFGIFVTPSTQLLFEAGQTLSVDNGPKESGRVNMRMITIF